VIHLTAALLFSLSMPATAPAVDHYQLRFAIDPQAHALTATAGLEIRNSGKRPITAVPVLLYRLMDVTAVSDSQGKPLRFTQKVVAFSDEPTWQVNAVGVRLGRPLPPGRTAAIHLSYGGSLFGYTEVMQYVRDTISEQYSLLRAETMVYPIVAPPSAAGWRASFKNEFDYEVETTVPAGYVAACSGDDFAEPQPPVDGKSTFRCSGEARSSQITVAIAKFRVLSDADRNLRVYAIDADAEAGAGVMADMRRALGFYRSYFGEMHRGGRLTLVEIPDGWGSYVLPGHIFQSAAAFRDRSRAPELYHEVGHIWNARASDAVQRSRYFDEAFASYFEALAVRDFEGPEAFRALMESYRKTYIERVERDPRGRTVPIAGYGKEEIGVFSYSKGAWSLYALHQLLGEEAFRRAIAGFLSAYAEKPAGFDDFRRSVEKSSGRDIGHWFEQWISGTASSAMLIEGKSVEEMERGKQ
jgi:aminopeptidase N